MFKSSWRKPFSSINVTLEHLKGLEPFPLDSQICFSPTKKVLFCIRLSPILTQLCKTSHKSKSSQQITEELFAELGMLWHEGVELSPGQHTSAGHSCPPGSPFHCDLLIGYLLVLGPAQVDLALSSASVRLESFFSKEQELCARMPLSRIDSVKYATEIGIVF